MAVEWLGEEEWVMAIVQSDREDGVQNLMKYQTVVSNYMEGCYSREMIPEVYYSKVIKGMINGYKEVRELGIA